MKLFKDFITRLSGRLLASVPSRLINGGKRRSGPSLRLVAHNPNPITSPDTPARRAAGVPSGHPDIEEALRRSQGWLLSRQHQEEGYWVADLEADTTLISEYLMLRRFIDRVDEERERKIVRYLRATQLEDGGWPIYSGGPSEISTSVKAYFALKLAGISAQEPYLMRARETILAKGGVTSANVFTKITLALFDQYDWRGVPSMPPEIMLLPKRFYFSVYAISYWSRAVLIPLLIIFTQRPVCRISPHEGIAELYTCPRHEVDYSTEPPFKKDPHWVSWRNIFIALDTMLKVYDTIAVRALREKGLRKAAEWMLGHMKGSGGLGAIYPAMANSVIALHALNYEVDHPLMAKALREIEALEVYDSADGDPAFADTMHVQPCFPPIWDTSLLCNALIESGLSREHPALQKAAQWMVSRQSSLVGDWKVSSPHAEPGGWAFQFENDLFPDIDDTAVVLMALAKLGAREEQGIQRSITRGYEWVVAMQGTDGGWGAYDKDNNKKIFNMIPFADHRALLDSSTADVAGRCLEMLGTLGFDRHHPSVRAGLDYLLGQQEQNGSWYGRWGVNYIYGTWSVLAGLRAIEEDLSSPPIQKAVAWLESIQNPDGGWGESCLSYADPSLAGRGESTPSQTAWALLGLLSAGSADSISVVRGVHYLLRHQGPDGSWEEYRHTGTGFPRVFYLRYHWYCQYFPLWALAMYRNIRTRGQSRADELRHLARSSGQFRNDS